MESMFTKENGQLMLNSLGVQQVTSTLYTIAPRIAEQKFYTIPFAEYLPVVSGVGAFMDKIGSWRTFSKSGGFEAGVQQNAANGARLEQVDAAFDLVEQKVLTWAKMISYSVIELQQSMQAGMLPSLIEARGRALKKEHDIGLQKTAFLGIYGQTGLLNNSEVYNDTATISKSLASMTATEMNTMVGAMYEKFRLNCNRTADPAIMILPEIVHNSLAMFTSPDFPLRSKLDVLKQAWVDLTGNANFQIKKCAYADAAQFGSSTYRYVLHSNDPDSLVMNVPLAFTQTAANSTNGFTWESAAYCQFTGVMMPRPQEVYYFSHS